MAPLLAGIVVGVAFAAFAAVGVALAVIDVREHRLPDAIVLPCYPAGVVLLGVAAFFGGDTAPLWRAVAAGAALFVFYALLRLISPRGMGGGDVKLAGVIGMALGWLGWPAVLVGSVAAFVIGGGIGLVLLASRAASTQTQIAFGPAMIAGAWVGIIACVAVGG